MEARKCIVCRGVSPASAAKHSGFSSSLVFCLAWDPQADTNELVQSVCKVKTICFS